MNLIPTEFEGLFVLEPMVWKDDRGYFFESFNKDVFRKISGLDIKFVQDNESKSKYGVLRGLHYQCFPFQQDKLIRVIRGSVLDVVVDLREDSKTYGKHFKIDLNEENKKQLFIPAGFAHGFLTKADDSIISYKCSAFYNKEHESGIRFDDKILEIDWGISIDEINLSSKDNELPYFAGHRKIFV